MLESKLSQDFQSDAGATGFTLSAKNVVKEMSAAPFKHSTAMPCPFCGRPDIYTSAGEKENPSGYYIPQEDFSSHCRFCNHRFSGRIYLLVTK
jgi:hypothetical protein